MGEVLVLYSNIPIAWMMAVLSYLVVSKPLGWSPAGIEYRRAFLYDVNPVGVCAIGIASMRRCRRIACCRMFSGSRMA